MADPKPVLPPFVPKIPGNVRLFKSRAETMGYVFESGANVHFINHRYLTKNPAEIAELERECANGHPCFWDDPDEPEFNPILVDPMEALRAKIREEERIKLMLSMGQDMGETTFSGKLEGIANSNSIRGLAVDSNGAPVGAGAIDAGSIKVASTPTSGATARKL